MSEEKHKDKNKKEPAKDMEIDIPGRLRRRRKNETGNRRA